MSAASQFSTRFVVTINAAVLPEATIELLMRLDIEDSRTLPSVCVLEFRDPGNALTLESQAVVGALVTVAALNEEYPAGSPLFTGELTGMEVEYDQTGNRTILRCMDVAHRLQRGTTTIAYVEMTYSEIVQQVALRNGIATGVVQPHPVVHDHVTQFNVDDWSFLQSLADEIGYVCRVEDGLVGFHLPTPASMAAPSTSWEDPAPLAFYSGDDSIRRLRSTVNSAQQVVGAQVKCWSPLVKEPYVGAFGALTATAETVAAPLELAETFGRAQVTAATRSYGTLLEVDAAAEALAARVAGSYAEIEAEVVGNPLVRSGAAIAIGGFGVSLDGSYTVSAASHHWNPYDGYRTEFTVSDRQDRSLLGLVAGGGASMTPMQVNGVVPAIVVSNEDLESLGRVTVTYPWLDATYVTNWARVVQAGAGAGRGMLVLPEVGDEVLVCFEHGDVNRPYVVGGLYNGLDRPAADPVTLVVSGEVMQRSFTSRLGHRIVFNDDPVEPTITIATGDQLTTLTLGGITSGMNVTTAQPVSIETLSTVAVTAGAGVTVQSDGVVNVTGSVVTVEAAADLSLTAAGAITVSAGAGLFMQSVGTVAITAPLVTVE